MQLSSESKVKIDWQKIVEGQERVTGTSAAVLRKYKNK